MKKITIFFLLFLVKLSAFAQVSTYGFTETTEAYSAVVGTASTASGDDGIENAIPIGFTFKYDGIDYTHFCISTNGWIKMGDASTTIGGSSWTNSLSNTATHRPLIAPFWDDNHRNSGTISYVVSGTAPNRTLEVGWDAINIGGSGSTSATNFASYKLRLYETTNVIEFVYGPTMATAGTLSASVGLNGASTFLSVTPAATSTTSSVTANNNITATTNLVGKKYRFTPPACLAPTGINASAILTTSATVAWTAPSPAPASGYEYVISTSSTAPAGAGTTTTATSVSATGLTPATTYYIFVRSNCGGSFSAWNGPVSFTTACVPVSLPWTENFDALTPGTNVFPNCWAYINTADSWFISTTPVANSGANSLRRRWSTDGWAFAPMATLTAGTSYTFSYYMRTNDTTVGYDITVGVGNAQTDVAMTNTLGSQTGYQGPTWTKFTYEFTPTATGDYSFGVHVVAPVAPNGINFDDFRLEVTPSCIEPNGLSASAITSTTATVSWNAATPVPASGYQYVVSTSNTTPAGAGTAAAGLTANVTSLTPNTTYYLFVRSNCGGTFSAWSPAYSFTTLCSPIATLPWTENFDALTTGTNIFPSCWAYANTSSNWSISTSPVAYSGANSLRRTWSTDGWAFTPMATLTAGTSYTFSYFVRTNDNVVGYDVTVGVGNTQTDVAMTNTLGSQTGYQGPTWTKFTYEFTPTATGDYSFGLHVVAPVDPNGINFDDFRIELTPACISPIPTASNITPTTADISWTTVTGTNYEYVLNTVATDPAGAGTSTTATTYAASSLLPATTYYFHIRNNCGGSGFSTWSTISFTTLPTPPANDNCSGAVTLVPAVDFPTGAVTGTLVGATDSEVADPTIPDPGCANYIGHDVWYTVTVPATGSITIETGDSPSSAVTDTGIAVYTGPCSALVLADCDDDSSLNGAFSLITLDGTTTPAVAPNDVLYVRVWRYGSTSTTKNINAVGEFRIAAYDPALSTNSFELNGFKAYPNPVKDLFTISYTKEISNVSVMNMIGQEVMNKKLNALQSTIDMSNLANGTYLVKVTVDGLVNTLKVVKQ